MRTAICDQLGIQYPIFGFTPSEHVAAAISRAGGIGVLGCVRFNDAEELDAVLSWMDENTDGKPYGVDIVMPMKYMGKGGGDEADFSNLDAMIPQEHRDFVEQLLQRFDVPPLPEDLDGGVIKAAGLSVDAEAPGQVEVQGLELDPERGDVLERQLAHGLELGLALGERPLLVVAPGRHESEPEPHQQE